MVPIHSIDESRIVYIDVISQKTSVVIDDTKFSEELFTISGIFVQLPPLLEEVSSYLIEVAEPYIDTFNDLSEKKLC